MNLKKERGDSYPCLPPTWLCTAVQVPKQPRCTSCKPGHLQVYIVKNLLPVLSKADDFATCKKVEVHAKNSTKKAEVV